MEGTTLESLAKISWLNTEGGMRGKWKQVSRCAGKDRRLEGKRLL